jgi:hypothetical protein
MPVLEAVLHAFAKCARPLISQSFFPNSCIASTAILIEVLAHYGFHGEPWEVCLTAAIPNEYGGGNLREVGCVPARNANGLGGHLVARVEERYIVDASFGQVSELEPEAHLPLVFVGRVDSAVDSRKFTVGKTEIEYRSRAIDSDWRNSPDWGPSPERDEVVKAIIAAIDKQLGIAS